MLTLTWPRWWCFMTDPMRLCWLYSSFSRATVDIILPSALLVRYLVRASTVARKVRWNFRSPECDNRKQRSQRPFIIEEWERFTITDSCSGHKKKKSAVASKLASLQKKPYLAKHPIDWIELTDSSIVLKRTLVWWWRWNKQELKNGWEYELS